MTLVVDASVALKWFLRGRPDEADVDAALALLQAHADGQVKLLQPPHFVAEVCAVLARAQPAAMSDNFADLLDLAMPVRADAALYARAMHLSHQLDHHLFDTLYHAVALETICTTLITADEQYFKKAQPLGCIRQLRQWADVR